MGVKRIAQTIGSLRPNTCTVSTLREHVDYAKFDSHCIETCIKRRQSKPKSSLPKGCTRIMVDPTAPYSPRPEPTCLFAPGPGSQPACSTTNGKMNINIFEEYIESLAEIPGKINIEETLENVSPPSMRSSKRSEPPGWPWRTHDYYTYHISRISEWLLSQQSRAVLER